MKIISSRNSTVETLSLGVIGSSASYTLYGDALFPNGQKTLTLNGVESVDITIAPNTASQTKFVELFQGIRRVETFAVQSPAHVRLDPFAVRGVTENVSGRVTGPVVVRNLTDGTEVEVKQLPKGTGTIRDVFIVPCTYSNDVHFMQANADTPTRLHTEVLDSMPVGVGAHRDSRTDERTFLLISRGGVIKYVSHVMGPLPSKQMSLAHGSTVVSAAVQTNAEGNALAIIAILSDGTLHSYPLAAALAPLAPVPIDATKNWLRLTPLTDSRILALADVEGDNSFTLTGNVLAPYKVGMVYGASRNQAGTCYFVHENGHVVARNETGDVSVPFTFDGLPVSQNYPGTEYGATDGSNYQLSGTAQASMDLRNPVAFHKMGTTQYAYCQPRTHMHVVAPVNTADYAATLTIVDRVVVNDVVTITLHVSAKPGVLLPIGKAPSSWPSFSLGGVATLAAQDGDSIVIQSSKANMLDSVLVFAVGNGVQEIYAIPDAVPDPFTVADIEDVEPGDMHFTQYIDLVGFDSPAKVFSNGKIYIDEVEVPDGTEILPMQTLRILIQQSDAPIDSWWVEVGGTRAFFTSAQDPQPVTASIKNRAYANLGTKVISKAIVNNYGVAVLLRLDSDLGYIAQHTNERQVVLIEGAVVNIVFEVAEYGHFDLPYRFGKSDHVWKVWADDHFLDAEPHTAEADRSVEATSPAFSFGAFPPNFYAIAKVPAGVRATIGGQPLQGQLDARGYLHSEQEVEFDLSSPVVYTAIPFEGGRTLDFGDVVALWDYDPIVTTITPSRSAHIVKKLGTQIAGFANTLMQIAKAPVSDVEPSSFVLYPMRKHESTSRPTQASVSSSLYEHVAIQAVQHQAPFTPASRHAATPHQYARAEAEAVDQSSHVGIQSLEWEFVQKGSHAAPYVETERVRTVPKLGPESFNFTRVPESEDLSTEAMLPEKVDPQVALTEALGTVPVWSRTLRHSVEFSTPALSKPNLYEGIEVDPETARLRAQYGILAATPLESARPEALASDVEVQLAVGTVPYTVEVDPEVSKAADIATVPIRALRTRIELIMGYVTIQPMKVVYPVDHDMIAPMFGSAVFPAARRNDYAIEARHYSNEKLSHAVIESSMAGRTAKVVVPLLASEVPEFKLRQVAAVSEAEAVQLRRSTGHRSDGSALSSSKVYDFAKYMTVAPMFVEHDGNPDYLDRGYFATELEALQNAVNVWGMQPIDVHAQQREGGEWYWVQTNKCVNMCGGCPPYGYLSGG